MNKFIAYLLFLMPLPVFCQRDFSKEIRTRLIATRGHDGKEYFQLGDYNIVTEMVENDFSTKKLHKLKKQLGVKNSEKEFRSQDIDVENLVAFKSEKVNPQLISFMTFYFIKKNEKAINVISFYSTNYRDTLIEKAFVKLYLNEKIPDTLFISRDVETIDFAGRQLKTVGKSCQLMNLRSVQCPYLGQMNWALHTDLSAAKESVNTQFETTKSRKLGTILEDDLIDVIFEQKETKARRIKLKIKVPKFLMGGSNILIVYYIAEEIRGVYLSCVLSHYDNDIVTSHGVPAFLSEVMALKNK